MKTYYHCVCDECGIAANKTFHFRGRGSCGDSFCWGSCDMRLCKGAEYDWCGAPECAAKMKSDMFVPLNLRKSNDQRR